MRKLVLGQVRTQDAQGMFLIGQSVRAGGVTSAFFDMSGRFRPAGVGVCGGAFRIGDRAAAHVWLADWRYRNPNRKLIVIEDSVMRGTEYSRALPGTWLFGDGIADEIWLVERPGETILRPPGQTLYHVPMWRIWRWLLFNCAATISISPPKDAFDRADKLLQQYGVPSKFVTCQPLFDAPYDGYRNASLTWWGEVVSHTSKRVPLVLLGLSENSGKLRVVGNSVYPVWNTPMDVMTTLAIICRATVHIGGATGTTLWASIFRRAVVACYVNWAPHSGKRTDTRPLSFGAPVVYAQLGSNAQAVAVKALGLFDETIIEGTPLQ